MMCYKYKYNIFAPRKLIQSLQIKVIVNMKKIMFMVAACAAMVACQNGKSTANNEGTDSTTQDSAVVGDSTVYEGMTPAADVVGIKYRVALAKDSTNGFSVSEAYMKSATEADTVYNYTGTYQIVKKNVKGKDNTYYQFELGKDNKTNFLVVNDSTLRLVNTDFEEPAVNTKDMNYDLKVK